jgi:hypothetical protein
MAKNTKTLLALKTIVESLDKDGYVNVKRSYIIGKANLAGLIEKDTYVILKPAAKSPDHRGHYVVAELLNIVNIALNKPAHKASAPAAKKAPAEITHDESDTNANLNVHAEWGEIPYSDADVADELSLMGTYVSSI